MNPDSEFRPCIVCGETEKINAYCEYSNFVYAHCTNCNLIYLNKFGTNIDMKTAYTGGSLKSLRRRLLGPFRKMKSVKGYKHFKQRASEIYQFAKNHSALKKNPTLIDIGCNKGFILSAAADDNCDVYGVELVDELTIPFKNTYPQFSNNIFSEKFSVVSRKFEDGFFDIITAIDVVEHFEDPVEDLKHIHRMLNKHGVFVIQTPDASCPEAKELACEWGALKPLEHLHLFNGENFTTLCKNIGFSNVSVHQPFEYADGNFVAVLTK